MAYNEDTDTLLIQSAADNSLSQGSKASADPDDLILVQRGDTLYQAKVSDLPSGPVAPPSNVAINLKQDAVNADRFTSNSFTTEVTGNDIEGVELKGEVTGALGLEAATLPITNNAYPGTNSTEVVLTLTDATNLDGKTFAKDDVVKSSASHTPVSDSIVKVEAASYSNSVRAIQGDFYEPPGYAYGPESLFDGDLNTAMYMSGNSDTTNSLPAKMVVDLNIQNVTKLRIYVKSASMAGEAIANNGSTTGSSSTTGWIDISNPPSHLTSITMGPSAFASNSWNVGAIEVNDVILLDSDAGTKLTLSGPTDIKLFQAGDAVQGDVWNQSQVWSSYVNTDNATDTAGNVNALFDGDTTKFYTVKAGFATWTPPNPIGKSSLRFYGNYTSPSQSITFNWDGGSYTYPSLVNNSWVDVTDEVTFPITSIQMTAGSKGIAVSAFEVDGILLIDQGIANTSEVKIISTNVAARTITVDGGEWYADPANGGNGSGNTAGDKTVSTVVSKQGEGTISDITDNVVTIEPFTDNCFKEGDYLTVNKTLRITPKTTAITGYDKDTKTISLTDQTNLLNFENGDSVYMCDANGDVASFVPVSDSIESITTKVYSSLPKSDFTAHATYVWERGFNGVQNSSLSTTSFTWLPDIQNVTTLDVYIASGASDNWTFKVTANGVEKEITGPEPYLQTNPLSWTFSPGTTLASVFFDKNSRPYIGITKIVINGQELIDNSATVLKFLTDKDLAYFRPGDVVQNIDTQVDWEDFPDEYTGRPLSNAFDGDPLTSFLQGGTPGDWLKISSPTTINSFEIDLAAAQQNEPYAVNITNPDGTTNRFAPSFTGSAWAKYSWTGVGTSKEIYIESTPDNPSTWMAIGFAYLEVNGSVVTEFGHTAKVISIDDSVPSITVDGGEWYADPTNGGDGSGTVDGDTEVTGPSKSGSGTFDSADAENNTMLLSVSNDMWPNGYYVATAEKDAVSMTAYLDFDANGQNTQLTSIPQSGVNMNSTTTPQIYFPVEFNTGEAPDTDIPAGSYLQTKVVAKNDIGSADELTSNVLVPATTTYTAPAAGSVRYTTEEFGEFCRWACSSDYRTAIKTIQDTENTVTEFRDKALDMAQAYIDAQE